MDSLYAKKNGVWGAYNANLVYRKQNGQWVASDVNPSDGNYMFDFLPSNKQKINYVSFGDSIAAGDKINSDWSANNKLNTQYGKGGRTQPTEIIPGTYTYLIQKELEAIYGVNNVSATSFASSGYKVEDLIKILSHNIVRTTLAEADVVTICIGANDVLQDALDYIPTYIADPINKLGPLEVKVEANLTELKTDSYQYSYGELLEMLTSINPSAKYVFTTVYNPFKYLFMDANFFDPLKSFSNAALGWFTIDLDELVMEAIGKGGTQLSYPTFSGNLWEIGDERNWTWHAIQWEISLADIVNAVLDAAVALVRYKINNLAPWVERYVNKLNDEVVRPKATGTNIVVAETKALFDKFGNRTSGLVDYTELVNNQITDGYDTTKIRWELLWKNEGCNNIGEYLLYDILEYDFSVNKDKVWQLITSLFTGSSAPSWDEYITIKLRGKEITSANQLTDWVFLEPIINAAALELGLELYENILLSEIDVHPQEKGHAVLKRSFTNMLGLIKYNTSGSYVPGDVVLYGGKPPYTESTTDGHTFVGWCTDSNYTQPLNPNTTQFVDHDSDINLSELVSGNSIISKRPKVTTLYAKWAADK